MLRGDTLTYRLSAVCGWRRLIRDIRLLFLDSHPGLFITRLAESRSRFGNELPRFRLLSPIRGKQEEARQRESRTIERRYTIKRQRPRTPCDVSVHKRRQPSTCNHFSVDYPRRVFDRTTTFPRATRCFPDPRCLQRGQWVWTVVINTPARPHTMSYWLRTWEHAVHAGGRAGCIRRVFSRTGDRKERAYMPWFTHVPSVCTYLCVLVIFSPFIYFLTSPSRVSESR